MNLILALRKIRVEVSVSSGLAGKAVDFSCMLFSNLAQAMSFNTVTNIVSAKEWFIFQDQAPVEVVAWFITDPARECNIIASRGLLY